MLGWGGGDVNVPCTCTHVGCYARCWVGVGVDVNIPSNHKTFWKNFKKNWRSKSKCQNASSFRVHKKRTFGIKHNKMALAKREYQWNCAEKSRAAAWTPKTNGNTDSKLRKIQAMYWKHHGRLHTVYHVVGFHRGISSAVSLNFGSAFALLLFNRSSKKCFFAHVFFGNGCHTGDWQFRKKVVS